MSYRPEGFERPEAAGDLEMLGQIGWLGEDAREPVGLVDGVYVHQHPEMLIAADPQLHRVVDQWVTGARRKVRCGDSNWRTVALVAMRGAHDREARRQHDRDIAALSGGAT